MHHRTKQIQEGIMQWFFDLIASNQTVEIWRQKGMIGPLIRVLRGGNRDLKHRAEAALAEIGPAAIPKLLQASRRHGYGVLTEAGAAMGMMGEGAILPLIEALENENDRRVAKAIAIALGAIGDARAVPSLTAAMKRIEEVDAIPEALGRIRDWRAAEALMDAYLLTESDSYRDDYVGRALKMIARAVPDDKLELREKIKEMLSRQKQMRSAERQKARKTGREGAPATWESVAESFITLIRARKALDFEGFRESLQSFPAEEQHGAWARVAWAFGQSSRAVLALQCFVQSIVCDPDPQSASWTQIGESLSSEASPDVRAKLSNLPRPRRPGDAEDLAPLARDLEQLVGFPGA